MSGRPASFARRLSALDPRLLDVALAVALGVGTSLWEVPELGKGRPADAQSLALTALVNAPLALRRRAPFTVLVVSTSAALLYHLLGHHPGLNSIGPLLALAEQLAAERDAAARRAVTRERVRIARELHDVVAHHGHTPTRPARRSPPRALTCRVTCMEVIFGRCTSGQTRSPKPAPTPCVPVVAPFRRAARMSG
ncbi:hypothetical protein [Nonomuraea sp. NPDC003709]|uniref:DUF7134 domain-containing protein n=1 Tax=Nonomuraea sp. NPDC003709 TaxID=3154450 RepID=UPI0033B9D2F5